MPLHAGFRDHRRVPAPGGRFGSYGSRRANVGPLPARPIPAGAAQELRRDAQEAPEGHQDDLDDAPELRSQRVPVYTSQKVMGWAVINRMIPTRKRLRKGDAAHIPTNLPLKDFYNKRDSIQQFIPALHTDVFTSPGFKSSRVDLHASIAHEAQSYLDSPAKFANDPSLVRLEYRGHHSLPDMPENELTGAHRCLSMCAKFGVPEKSYIIGQGGRVTEQSNQDNRQTFRDFYKTGTVCLMRWEALPSSQRAPAVEGAEETGPPRTFYSIVAINGRIHPQSFTFDGIMSSIPDSESNPGQDFIPFAWVPNHVRNQVLGPSAWMASIIKTDGTRGQLEQHRAVEIVALHDLSDYAREISAISRPSRIGKDFLRNWATAGLGGESAPRPSGEAVAALGELVRTQLPQLDLDQDGVLFERFIRMLYMFCGSSPNMAWIQGVPGSGKSYIAFALIVALIHMHHHALHIERAWHGIDNSIGKYVLPLGNPVINIDLTGTRRKTVYCVDTNLAVTDACVRTISLSQRVGYHAVSRYIIHSTTQSEISDRTAWHSDFAHALHLVQPMFPYFIDEWRRNVVDLKSRVRRNEDLLKRLGGQVSITPDENTEMQEARNQIRVDTRDIWQLEGDANAMENSLQSTLITVLKHEKYAGLVDWCFKFRLSDHVFVQRRSYSLSLSTGQLEESMERGVMTPEAWVVEQTQAEDGSNTNWGRVEPASLMEARSVWDLRHDRVLPSESSCPFGTYVRLAAAIIFSTSGHFQANLARIIEPDDINLFNDEVGRQRKGTQTAHVCASHTSLHVGDWKQYGPFRKWAIDDLRTSQNEPGIADSFLKLYLRDETKDVTKVNATRRLNFYSSVTTKDLNYSELTFNSEWAMQRLGQTHIPRTLLGGIVFLDVKGETFRNSDKSRYNIAEAKAALQYVSANHYVEAVYAQTHPNFTLSDHVLTSQYSAQVECFEKLAATPDFAYLLEVEADGDRAKLGADQPGRSDLAEAYPIIRFNGLLELQGCEGSVLIVTFVCSDNIGYSLEEGKTNTPGFAQRDDFFKTLLNVATTRGMRRVVVVADRTFWRKFPACASQLERFAELATQATCIYEITSERTVSQVFADEMASGAYAGIGVYAGDFPAQAKQ